MSFERPLHAKGEFICFCERAAGSQLCCLLSARLETSALAGAHVPPSLAGASQPPLPCHWEGLMVWLMVHHMCKALHKHCFSFQKTETGYRYLLLYPHVQM